ncbi:MAG: glycosyltransferase [Actinomycetota bacterium]
MELRHLAVVAYHSSPLLEPGTGDAGGMTVYVREVAEALAERGVTTDIFTRATTEFDRTVELAPGVRVVSISAGPRAPVEKAKLGAHLEDFVTGIRAFAMAQRMRYDLVHSHYWQSGLAARLLARAWGVPLVHSHHTLGRVKNNHLAPGDKPEPRSRLDGEATVIDTADVLISSTDDEWKQLACLYSAPHDQIKTIHPGVDHSLFYPGDRAAARAELGLGDERVLLYVGRIQPLKGLELAVRAVEELRPALDERLAFLVVGGASGEQGGRELRRLEHIVAHLGLTDSVRFVGPQPHSLLPVFYRAADAVVVCSYSESFGLAALEAHACGIPVVGTAVGGLSYVVQDGISGWLVDTRDPSVFGARLKTVLSDDELRKQFGAAAVDSAARFSWAKTADELLELYECLAREELVEACTC